MYKNAGKPHFSARRYKERMKRRKEAAEAAKTAKAAKSAKPTAKAMAPAQPHVPTAREITRKQLDYAVARIAKAVRDAPASEPQYQLVKRTDSTPKADHTA